MIFFIVDTTGVNYYNYYIFFTIMSNGAATWDANLKIRIQMFFTTGMTVHPILKFHLIIIYRIIFVDN